MATKRTLFILALLLAVPLTFAVTYGTSSGGGDTTPAEGTERVIFVGNNWDGTADVLQFDPDEGTFEQIKRYNIIPDLEERMEEIYTDPERLGFFLGIRMVVGEGNDQFVDDMYSVQDGTVLVVSRPSLRDVIGMDLANGEILWRFVVDGQRSDHMAVSPDGKHVAVSASTGNVVHILDTATGQEVGTFPSGDSPHENIYSDDGERIYHASIGLVYTPADHPLLDSTKGERYFQVVDAEDNSIISRVNMGNKLAQAGYEDMSAAVRPMAITADESTAYLQVSFYHGFVEYDLANQQVRGITDLPNLIPNTPREQYLLDSAHHGISLNADDTKLCVAGTMSDYAAIVDVSEQDASPYEDYTLIQKPKDAKPYWATTSDDGQHCLVSWSGLDTISAISYDTAEEVAEVDVGYHPQRVRTGDLDAGIIAAAS